MAKNKDIVIENLEAIYEEISCDELESNESLLEIINNVILYLDDKDEFFVYHKEYDDINEVIDSIKSCIDELVCDDADKDTIKYLKDALEIIKEDV